MLLIFINKFDPLISSERKTWFYVKSREKRDLEKSSSNFQKHVFIEMFMLIILINVMNIIENLQMVPPFPWSQ